MRRAATLLVLALLLLARDRAWPRAQLEERNEVLFRQMQEVHGLTEQQMATCARSSPAPACIGQGNPAITEHPVTPEQCRAKLEQQAVATATRVRANLRRAKYMAPLYDPASEAARGRQGLHRSVRVPRHPLRLPGGLGAGARGGGAVRRDGQAAVRRARVGRRLRRQPRAARLPLRPGRGRQPERRGRAHAHSPQPGARGRQDLELRPRLSRRACAPPPATRAGPATAAAGRCAAPTPTRPAPSPTATARSASTTSTATPPST